MRLDATDLRIEIGQRVLHEHLSFSVVSGQSLAIIGPSGSGKSTLLSVIAGYFPIVAGSLDVKGSDRSAEIQWLVQSTPLLTRRTVWDNCVLAARIRGMPAAAIFARANELLDELGIRQLSDTPVHRLSGGERQRVAVVRTILSQPDIVLADEPTASLDPRSRDDVVEALDRVASSGAILIVATHDAVVAEACDAKLAL